MDFQITALSFPALVGIVGVVIVALINQVHWPRNIKQIISFIVPVVLVAVGVLFHYVPRTGEAVLAFMSVAYAISQVVYVALKPTGLVDWVTEATSISSKSEEPRD